MKDQNVNIPIKNALIGSLKSGPPPHTNRTLLIQFIKF